MYEEGATEHETSTNAMNRKFRKTSDRRRAIVTGRIRLGEEALPVSAVLGAGLCESWRRGWIIGRVHRA